MKTIKPKAPLKILLALAICTIASGRSEVIASEYDQGLKLYQAKNYTAALPLLEKAANAKTNAWQAQYLLGNTCLALGKMDEAKAAYQRCLATCNDKSIQDHAKGGIATVDAYKQAQAQAQTLRKSTATNGSSSSSSSSSKASDNEEEEVAEKKTDKNAQIRNELLAKARQEANKIRREAEDQIKHEKENSNEYFQFSDGSIKLDISNAREEQIRKEADEKAKRIMYEAEQRAKGYRSN
ncbi:MAG: tetratricopeptide repeat protein [Candidatus Obscuribacterales bacterium]|nr:tetratricopeptide repeat protein [Candidatus Obscuribacterales bacterium]